MVYLRTVLLKNRIQVIDTDGDGIGDSIVYLPKDPINIQFTMTEDVQNLGLYTEYEELGEEIDLNGMWDTTNYGGGDGGTGYTQSGGLPPYGGTGDTTDNNGLTDVEGCTDPLADNYNPAATVYLVGSCTYDFGGVGGGGEGGGTGSGGGFGGSSPTPDPSLLNASNTRCTEGYLYFYGGGDRHYYAIYPKFISTQTRYIWKWVTAGGSRGAENLNLSDHQRRLSDARDNKNGYGVWISIGEENNYLKAGNFPSDAPTYLGGATFDSGGFHVVRGRTYITQYGGVPATDYRNLGIAVGDAIDGSTSLGGRVRSTAEYISSQMAKRLGKNGGTVINSCPNYNPPCYGCRNGTNTNSFGESTDIAPHARNGDGSLKGQGVDGWYKCSCNLNGTNWRPHASVTGGWGDGLNSNGSVLAGGIGKFDTLTSVFGGLYFTPAGNYLSGGSNGDDDFYGNSFPTGVDFLYAYKVNWMFYME
jgi:hypothetical protein